MRLHWVMKVQDGGRIQIPSAYLESYKIETGDCVEIKINENDENVLFLTFGVDENGEKLSEKHRERGKAGRR